MKNKKRIFFLSLIFLFLQFSFIPQVFSCTCAYIEHFCSNSHEGSHIVSAEIIDSLDEQLRYIKIIDRLNLEIENDTIILRGGNDANCGEDLKQFEIGDSLVLSLDKGNLNGMVVYSLIGACGRHYLRYSNGQVSGSIKPNAESMSYDDFVMEFKTCIDFFVNTNNLQANKYNIQFSPIPVQDQLRISLDQNHILDYEVYHINGQMITSKYGLNESQLLLDWDNWQTGLYVIRLFLEDGVFSKIVPKT